jgi:molecular chaperone GrpE
MFKHLLVQSLVPSRFLLTKSLRPLSALTSNCSISSSHSYSTSSSNEKTNQEPKAKEDQEPSENLHDEKVIELKEVIVKKDLEIVELKDLYRRALADAENVRIRTTKELVHKSAYAIQSFAKDLLSTADILELALKSVPENDRGELGNKELKALWTGVSLTKKELLKVFGQHGITEFNPIGIFYLMLWMFFSFLYL